MQKEKRKIPWVVFGRWDATKTPQELIRLETKRAKTRAKNKVARKSRKKNR